MTFEVCNRDGCNAIVEKNAEYIELKNNDPFYCERCYTKRLLLSYPVPQEIIDMWKTPQHAMPSNESGFVLKKPI